MNTATKVGSKKIIDITKKQGSEFAKTAGKKIVQKSADATGDLIGNKIADKKKVNQKIKKMKQVKKKLIFHQKKDNKSLMA